MEIMTQEYDPKTDRLRAVIRAWSTAFGTNSVRAKNIVELIRRPNSDEACELRDVMRSFACNFRGEVSPERIGKWLQHNLGRHVAIDGFNYHFASESNTNGVKWRLEMDVD